jgi:hypothetical protein
MKFLLEGILPPKKELFFEESTESITRTEE